MKHGLSTGILAGGKSSRMGTDKALIRIGNERIINRISKELEGFSEIIVSAGSNRAYEDMGFHTVYDENVDIGPMEGIRQVLLNAKEEYVFICAADMPFISRELVEYMAGYISSDHDCYVIADEDHIHPLCAIYKKSVLPVIEELIAGKRYRLREIFSLVSTKYISLDNTVFDKKIVRNINTRKELFEVQKPLVFCVSGYSNSGKTGLIERLINEFIKDGMSVGVIKHDGHDAFSDLPGSDTDRFKSAGAKCTAVFSDKRYSYSCTDTADANTLIRMMSSSVDPPDVIMIEGLKDSAYPKVEVIRRDVFDKSVSPKDSLICLATDCIPPESVNVPVFDTDDAKGIFLCVKNYFEKEIET
ncbi:MAG: molybdopterin-guanine dinucleotide biosynthesis protein B [Lachnospiraceae bacterium]|nr:molybdopterin-guanine dinucleotide biosynthesis protein B [Lachnospiraceae bacterium]